jgi:D-sedoheptulose 7-phosphate isomerase
MSLEERIVEALRESARIKSAVADADSTLIAQITMLIIEQIRAGGTVFFLGNGGSAADAQHLAAELVCKFRRERSAIRAIALTANTSILTAIGNDYGYKQVFVRQVEALVREGDVVIGISTSGSSPNVLGAMRAARKKGAKLIGFTGQNGQKLAELVDLCLIVPSVDPARIQETHITVGHAICELMEELL